MATSTVTITVDKMALSESVRFEPLPNQVVDDIVVDTAPIWATASGNTYTATLQQNARYRVVAHRLGGLHNTIITVDPDAATDVNAEITGARRG